MSAVPEVSAEQIASASSKPEEVRKLILKLRWIGMDEEADRLNATLAGLIPAQCTFMGPRDTD